MKKTGKQMKIGVLSLLFVLVITLSSLFALGSCENKGVYEKTFTSISDIKYDAKNYVKIPELSEIVLHRSVIEQKVEYALVSLLLTDAEHTVYEETGSADVMLYDIVNVTYTAKPASDGVKLSEDLLASLSTGDDGKNIVIGSGEFVGAYYGDDGEKLSEGFEAQLVGVKVGTVKEINVTYSDYYPEAKLRGVQMRFTVTVNSIKRPEIGALTDDICYQRTGYESVEAYREYLTDYYMGEEAYDAVLARSETLSHCQEIVDLYVDKYIHENVVYTYGSDLSEKEYKKAYKDVYDSMKDEATVWATGVAEERVILTYLFEKCSITLDDSEYKKLLDEDWNENKEAYESQHAIRDAEMLEKYFGRAELEFAYKFDKLLKVLPDKLTVI